MQNSGAKRLKVAFIMLGIEWTKVTNDCLRI